MAIDDDVKITINLNKLVEIRAKLMTQHEDYSQAITSGEYLDENDIDKLATQLRDTLTWDTLFHMIDGAILDYMGLRSSITEHRTHYGEIQPEPGREAELTKREAEAKKRKQYFEKNFDLVELDGGSWKLQVPVRKK